MQELFWRGAVWFDSRSERSLSHQEPRPSLSGAFSKLTDFFPFCGLTLGGLSSSGKAQCHNQFHFESSNCMIKVYIFSAVVWLRDRGNRGDTPLAINITRSTVPLLSSATVHPFAHLRSGFQVLASPKKPAEQLLTSRNVVNHIIH